jgi:predicted DNA-binding protein with PD1-like motif
MNFFKKHLKLMTILVSAFAATNAMAAGKYIAVDQYSCGERANSPEPFMLILKTGESLHDGIKKCARDAKLIGASIQGLGQFVDPTFAYYGPNAQPRIIPLKGVFELISLNGNVAISNGEYYTHIHTTLGNEALEAKAGHIKDTTIGVTAELTITPFSKPLERQVDPETGFGPIITEKSGKHNLKAN